MFKNVIFYNYVNNGDWHLVRSFIRYFIERFPEYNYSYSHKNAPNLLADIEKLTFDSSNVWAKLPQDGGITRHEDSVYVNTWVAACKGQFNTEGCTIQGLWNLFNHYAKELFCDDLSGKGIVGFYPYIDFDKFSITKVNKFFEHNCEDRIFISNGYVQSGQAVNFDMSPLIESLANKFPEKQFIVTNKKDYFAFKLNNIFFTEDIIGSTVGSNLNENAYISCMCDKIIGRSSGAASFALNIDNFLDGVEFYSIALSNDCFNGFDRLNLPCKFTRLTDNYEAELIGSLSQ